MIRKLELGDKVISKKYPLYGIGTVVSPSGFFMRLIEKDGVVKYETTAMIQFEQIRVVDTDDGFIFIESGPAPKDLFTEILKNNKL